MDSILDSLSEFNVSGEPNSIHSPHPRFSQFKKKSSKSSQEERRKAFLDARKQARYDLLNLIRDVEPEEEQPQEEQMSNAQECYRRPSKYRDFIMLSEWLVDVPENFATEYYAMPTPVGKRCLVVADGGKSLLFGRNGKLLEKFISVLPGGSRDTSNKGYAILDVIVNYENDTIYIVDMVAWRNQSHIQCETEFRFEWLKARLEESDVDVSSTSANNQYKFQQVPVYPCDNSSLGRMMAHPFSFDVDVDGVMFYHKEGHYTHGQTPLVGWLKPFMLPEILGVPVPEKFQSERPSEYTNLSQHIEYGRVSRIARLERNAETKEKCRLEKLKKIQDKQAANNEQGGMDLSENSREEADQEHVSMDS